MKVKISVLCGEKCNMLWLNPCISMVLFTLVWSHFYRDSSKNTVHSTLCDILSCMPYGTPHFKKVQYIMHDGMNVVMILLVFFTLMPHEHANTDTPLRTELVSHWVTYMQVWTVPPGLCDRIILHIIHIFNECIIFLVADKTKQKFRQL